MMASFLLESELLKIIMKTFLFLFSTVVFGLTPINALTQNAKVFIKENNTLSVDEIFNLIKSQTEYTFVYQDGLFDGLPKVQLEKGTIRTKDLLDKALLKGNYLFDQQNNIIQLTKSSEELNAAFQRIITGKVTDSQGIGIPGVNVINGQQGTATDMDGNFVVNAKQGDVLVFSFIGFTTQKITVGDQATINVILAEEIAALDEVVLLGYGKTSNEQMTGAATKIDTKTLYTTQNVSYADALIGIVPGLLVQESFNNPDTPPSILLRGVGSINADTEPLIVIDGIQMPQGFSSSAINVADVDGITILKDAAATSIYGSRGANGVILVTTKRGVKNNKLQVNFNTRVGFRNTNTSFTKDLMNTSQKLDYEESLGFYASNPALLEERRNSGNQVNWADILIGDEINQSHDISFMGGGEKSSYYSSISYNKVDNIFDTKYQRYTATMRADYEFSEKLKLEVSGNFGNVNNKDRRGVGSPFSNSFLLNPWENVFDESGNPLRTLVFSDGFGIPYNPLFIRENTQVNSVRKNIGGGVNLVYKPLDWLSFNGVIGANYNNYDNLRYENVIVEGGKLTVGKGSNSNYTATFMATVDKMIHKHGVNIVVGHEVNENKSSSLSGTANGFRSDAVKLLSAATNAPTLFEGKSHSGSLSYFSRLNYSFD